MQILGGMALPSRVNISSANFSVVARAGEDGNITTTVTPVSRVETWIRKQKWFPKVPKMFVFLFTKLAPKDRFIILAILIGIPVLISALFTPEQVQDFSDSGKTDLITWGFRILTFLIIGYTFVGVRGFHAAEHMAIAAYERHGVSGLDHVAEQDRVHDKCGGRMLFPLMFAILGGGLLANQWDTWWAGFIPLLLLEAVLWVDSLVGYDKIRFTNAISHWVQRTLTTKPPNELELNTGREALRALLIAEGELPSNQAA